MMANIQGCRIYPREDGHLYLKEGDYGFDLKVGHWVVRPPDCHAGGIPNHTVIEHEDKTITVSPSILLEDIDEQGKPKTWHGYLEHGIWREV